MFKVFKEYVIFSSSNSFNGYVYSTKIHQNQQSIAAEPPPVNDVPPVLFKSTIQLGTPYTNNIQTNNKLQKTHSRKQTKHHHAVALSARYTFSQQDFWICFN